MRVDSSAHLTRTRYRSIAISRMWLLWKTSFRESLLKQKLNGCMAGNLILLPGTSFLLVKSNSMLVAYNNGTQYQYHIKLLHWQVMYVDTRDSLPNHASLSHVAINSMVGVKLPED